MPGSDDNFILDQAMAQETFARLNDELFGGQLERIPIRLSSAVWKGGSYTAKMFYEQPNARMRRLLRDYRIKDLHDQAINLSRKVILTQDILDRIMAHELIHQWQASVLGISEDNSGHGETFHNKMNEINVLKGAGFVTITSDVVVGGTGGKSGQTYYVAIFENAGRKFGGFSRRPFTEKILAILRQSSERSSIQYRTIVTTSHDAQNLKDMSRMKLSSRGRSWTVIPDDIYDAIMSAEVTTAALRAAALEVAASSGTMIAYHATLSGSDILEGGFKKSDEVERVGLGGSSVGGSVSFTTDWAVAKGIHKSFVMMHSLVNAEDPLAAMREHFESLDSRLADSVSKYWTSAEGGDIQELLGGWKPKPYGMRAQTYDQLVQKGFKPVDAVGGEGLGGKGDTPYYQWLEPVMGEDVERMVYTYVKVYFYANDKEYNPVFMGGDASHFKGIPQDDIGVITVELHIDPSKKHETHGELDRSPGYAILPAESEYRVSDMSMIGEILDYDTHPGDEPKVRAGEVSFHSDVETEDAVNRLLSLLQRHRGIIERGDKLDVQQAMAQLRNADNMWDVSGMASKILAVVGIKHVKRALENAVDLQKRSQPSEDGSKAIAALPQPVQGEVERAAHTERFADISERWYDRDEPSYIAWVDRLGDLGMSESIAEFEIDDWISSKQFGYEGRYAEEMKWVKMDVPGFREEDAGEFLELIMGLEEATQHSTKASSTLRVAIRTVFETTGDQSKGQHFILRQGKLWLWSSDMGEADEKRLVESIREEFKTDQPPFDQKIPIDNKYRVRDMFEPSGLFGPLSDEDMTKFREFASDTLIGMVLPDGTLRAKTVAGLPIHADHPEMEKLLKHLGAEMASPRPKGVWYHGFIATPERMAGVARFGLRPGDAVQESNWERNEEYDRSLVYLTTDAMNAKGHATGNERRYPYAVVVSVREDNLDLTRMESDFDAARVGFKPNRAGLAGYRGRIPVSIFSEVRIYRNGYNQDTTPLLLTLGPDEFAPLAKEYAAWAERTNDDREAIEKEMMHPSFMDRSRVQELRGKIGKDPIRLAIDAPTTKDVADIAASLHAASVRTTAAREPEFLKRLQDAGALPTPDVVSDALSDVASGTLIHNAAGSVGTPGEDLSEKIQSILDNGLDPAYWAKPWAGSPGEGHPQAVYLSLAGEAILDNPPPNYLLVEPKLSRPLVLRAGDADGNYTWGPALNEATGKSGAGLSSFLRSRGYDSVITVHKYGVGEVAYFGKEPLPAFLPEPDRMAHVLGAAAETVSRTAAVEDIYRGVKTVIEKYKGKGLFARFSDVPKIGIRPSTEHHDPYGVYFYPVDWLAEESGFGTTYINLPYITVARIRRSGWLNLATVRPAKARELAEKGGVLEEYEARTKGTGLNQTKGGRAGKRLWDAVEAKVKPRDSEANKMEWNRIFGRMGVKAIYDPGTGSVNTAEPSQIVVLDLSLIKVVDVVDNKEDRKSVFHAVLKAVADEVLDDGWRVSGSHAEGGIMADGTVSGQPVAMSVMPAKSGFEMEVTLSYHDPSGKKQRIVTRGRMPNEWEDAPAAYLSEGHARSISRSLEEADIGAGGERDAKDMLDDALRALTRLRLPDLKVEEKGSGVEFWKNTGDGKIEGSLKVLPDSRRELELYAEDWLLLGGEDSTVIEIGPMRVSWEGEDPSSASADMATELSRAIRELRVTVDNGKPRSGVDMDAAAELVRKRTLSWMFPSDILAAAGERKAAAALQGARLRLASDSDHPYVPPAAGVRMPSRVTPDIHDAISNLFKGVDECRTAMPYLREPKCPRCGHIGPGDPKVEAWASLPDNYREFLQQYYDNSDRQEIARRLMWDQTIPTYCGECGNVYVFEKDGENKVAGRLKAWHGTINRRLDLIRDSGGLKDMGVQASLPPTTFTGLPDAVRADIAENLHDAFFAGTDVSHEVLRGVLEDMDTPLPTVRQPVSDLASQAQTSTSSTAVASLAETLRRVGELDPILTNAGQFHDGGHRVMAYEAEGRDTIPTVDIAPLLTADWEAEFNEEIPGLARPVAGKPRFVTMDEMARMATTRYYHGTTAGAMRLVERDGYLRAPVHLADSVAAAREFANMAADDARDRQMVLEVVLPQAQIDKLRDDTEFDGAPGNFVLDENVPLEWIPWYPDPDDPDPTGSSSFLASALSRAAAEITPEPWQVTQSEFIEILNRSSGKKHLPDYKPRDTESFAHMNETPMSDIESVTLRDGGILELKRSEKLVQYGRFVKQPDGTEKHESSEERPEETVFAIVDGRVVGYAGPSFGATEMFLSKDEQSRGIGPELYKAYLKEFPHRHHAGGFTSSGLETAKATHRKFVEEAVAAGKPVLPEVLADYPHGFGSLRATVEFRGDEAALKEMRVYVEVYGGGEFGEGWVRMTVRPANVGNISAMQHFAEEKGGNLTGTLLTPPGYPPAAAEELAAKGGWGISTAKAASGQLDAAAAIDLASVRKFLEGKWASRGRPEPGQSCTATASFLSKLIPGAVVRGGQPEGHRDLVRHGLATDEEARSGGGYRDADGYLLPHIWVEAGGKIYDLAADQFGADPVTVTEASDSRYVSTELSEKNARTLRAVDAETDEWLEEWESGRTASTAVEFKESDETGVHRITATIDGAEVGTLEWQLHPNAGRVNLLYIGVDPDRRGEGIGEALLRRFERSARAAGSEGFYGDVTSLGAMRLVERVFGPPTEREDIGAVPERSPEDESGVIDVQERIDAVWDWPELDLTAALSRAAIVVLAANDWYHGTSKAAEEAIRSGGEVRPSFTESNVSLGGAYLTKRRDLAEVYAREAAREHGSEPVVLTVTANESDLLPDEDWPVRLMDVDEDVDDRLQGFLDDLFEGYLGEGHSLSDHYKDRYDELNDFHGITWQDSLRWSGSVRQPYQLSTAQLVGSATAALSRAAKGYESARWYYHGSAPDDILDVAQWGLLARGDRDGISVTTTVAKAKDWAGLKTHDAERIEVFRIPASVIPDLTPENAAPAEPDKDFTVNAKQIPPEHLQIMRDGSWTPLLDVYGEFLDEELQADLEAPEQHAVLHAARVFTATVEAWHGTDSDYTKFDMAFAHGQLGFHFGTKEQASDVFGDIPPRRIIRVELDIENPLRMPDLGGWQGHAAKTEFEKALGVKIPGSGGDKSIVQAVQDAGYDSIVYANKFEGEGEGDSYIVFDASKIKMDPITASLSRATRALGETRELSDWDSQYPVAGDLVDGRNVLSDVPNTSSISASFEEWEELPGIREVPMSELDPKSMFYAADDFKRSRDLALRIKESDEIKPLIIAIDDEGPYILEGAHRFVALHELGAKSFPALVVIDRDNQNVSASLSRAARALGEHLGETVTAYRSVDAGRAEEVMRMGFTGERWGDLASRGVYYTASPERGAFYARFNADGRWGVMFELEADTSRSTADLNDTTEMQSEELMEEVRAAAGAMASALADAGVRLDGHELERWIGGRTVSEGYYEGPEQHSVWQLIVDETKGADNEMTIADAREALPPGKYGDMTVLDSRGVAGIDIGEVEGQAQAMSSAGIPLERLTAVWLPSSMLEAAGEPAPAGAETMSDQVDVIPYKLGDEGEVAAEAEKQRDEARARYESDPPEGMDKADEGAYYDGLEEVADAMDSILDRWRDENDSTMPGHVYSKLVEGETVTLGDLDREESLVRYPLPKGRLQAVKVVRKAIAASEPGQGRKPGGEGIDMERAARRAAGEVDMIDDNTIARALRRAAAGIGWSEESDVDPESFEDEGFVEDESGRTFWGSQGSGCLFVRNHPEDGQQLLLVKRSPQVEEPNTWGTTGGAVPNGESNLFASAVRETREEIGSIPPYEAVKQYVWRAPGGTFTYTTFILECTDMGWLPAAFNWEATDAQWVSLEEATSYDLHFGLNAILGDLAESIFPVTEATNE